MHACIFSLPRQQLTPTCEAKARILVRRRHDINTLVCTAGRLLVYIRGRVQNGGISRSARATLRNSALSTYFPSVPFCASSRVERATNKETRGRLQKRADH